jgi:hypothetical protein
VIESLRGDLAAALAAGDGARAGEIATAARRLAAIDPERRAAGGLRFQLELAVVESAARSGRPAVAPAAPSPTPAPARPRANGSTAPTSTAPTAAADVPRPTPSATAPPAATEPNPDGASAARRVTGRSGPAAESPSAPPPAAAAAQPAEPPAARASAGSAGGATGEPGIDTLRAAWPEVVAQLSQSPPVKPLISECRPVSVDGSQVVLGFPEDKAFMKDLLERRRSVLEEGIGRVLGRAVNVRCVATNLEDVPPVPVGASADLISEARRIFADDLADVGEVS